MEQENERYRVKFFGFAGGKSKRFENIGNDTTCPVRQSYPVSRPFKAISVYVDQSQMLRPRRFALVQGSGVITSANPHVHVPFASIGKEERQKDRLGGTSPDKTVVECKDEEVINSEEASEIMSGTDRQVLIHGASHFQSD